MMRIHPGSAQPAVLRLPRTALATLELVLTLPVILVLFVALVWLGFSVIGQVEVTAAARHAAWSKRFAQWQPNKFDFTAEDSESGQDRRQVEVTPLLASEQGPSAEQEIDKGPWDHRLVEFERLPNWKLYAEVGVAAKTVNLKFAYEDARSLLGQVQQLGAQSLNQALAQFAAELLNPRDLFGSQAEAGESRTELDGQLEQQKLEGQIDDLQRQIERLKEKRRVARESEEESAEDQVWLIEQQLKRLGIELVVARSLAAAL